MTRALSLQNSHWWDSAGCCPAPQLAWSTEQLPWPEELGPREQLEPCLVHSLGTLKFLLLYYYFLSKMMELEKVTVIFFHYRNLSPTKIRCGNPTNIIHISRNCCGSALRGPEALCLGSTHVCFSHSPKEALWNPWGFVEHSLKTLVVLKCCSIFLSMYDKLLHITKDIWGTGRILGFSHLIIAAFESELGSLWGPKY